MQSQAIILHIICGILLLSLGLVIWDECDKINFELIDVVDAKSTQESKEQDNYANNGLKWNKWSYIFTISANSNSQEIDEKHNRTQTETVFQYFIQLRRKSKKLIRKVRSAQLNQTENWTNDTDSNNITSVFAEDGDLPNQNNLWVEAEETPDSSTTTVSNVNNDRTPAPKSEPETMQQPGPDVTSQPEPELEDIYYQYPETEPENWPEPGPNWTYAFLELGHAWPFHVVFFGLMYLLIASVASVVLLGIITSPLKSMSRIMTLSLNVMLVLFGATRCLSLFIDPYSSRNTLPFEVSRLLWSLGLPLLTSGFSLMLLALLDTTKMTVAPPRFQKLSTILGITLGHTVLVLSVDTIVFFFVAAKWLLVVCECIFVTWGLLLAIGYFVVAVKLRKNFASTWNTKAMQDEQGKRIYRLTIIIYISAFVGLAVCVTHLYSIAGMFGVYSDVQYVDSWSWWGLKTCLRIEEVLMCFLIFAMASRRPTLKSNNNYVGILEKYSTQIRRTLQTFRYRNKIQSRDSSNGSTAQLDPTLHINAIKGKFNKRSPTTFVVPMSSYDNAAMSISNISCESDDNNSVFP